MKPKHRPRSVFFLPPPLLALAFLLLPCGVLVAETPPFHIVERSDWSSYRDDRYSSHLWSESRLALEVPEGGTIEATAALGPLEGSWFVLEEKDRDLRAEARLLDRSGKARVILGSLGLVAPESDSPLPGLRGLLDLAHSTYRQGLPDPSQPRGAGGLLAVLPPGSSFVAPGQRLLDLGEGPFLLPFLAEYRVQSRGSYANRDALLVKAKFATRLDRPRGGLVSATGTHDLDIWLDLATGLPLLVRDRFDETFGLAGGKKERRAGSTLVFWQGGLFGQGGETGQGTIAGGGREALVAGLEGSLGLSAGPLPVEKSEEPLGSPPETAPAPGAFELARGENGVLLRINDLRFRADSAELLPDEKPRLDLIAAALLKLPAERNFLVEGHAARAGKPQGELELSRQRAKRIVDELVARGLAASRFIYRGLGSTHPLPDLPPASPRNRRVEITILD